MVEPQCRKQPLRVSAYEEKQVRSKDGLERRNTPTSSEGKHDLGMNMAIRLWKR